MHNRFQWPSGYKCAVSLTFDDSLPSQLRIAIPLLDKYGVKATFYINPSGNDWAERLKPWRKVSEEGHEIGNHTLSHPCSCVYPFSEGHCLEEMALEDIEADILEAQRRLESIAANGRVETFAYPCDESFVGRGALRRSYVPVVARYFLAARDGGYPPWSNNPLSCDLHHLWSWPADKLSLAEMVGLVELTANNGRWAIFTFHGVGGDYLQVPEDDFRVLLEYLVGRGDTWVAPVAQIAAYVSEKLKELQRL
jgi:peptidoglycan/xylan/chitin deacetylase (PgdA/CDA1 family)